MTIASKFWLTVVCLAAPALAWPQPARAALLDGQTFSATRSFKMTPDSQQGGATAFDLVVGPEVELPSFGEQILPPDPALYRVDVSDRQIHITALRDQPAIALEALTITFYDPQDLNHRPVRITRIDVNPATTMPGIELFNRISNGISNVGFNFSGLPFETGQVVLVDLVPEPAAAGLMATALAGLTAVRRRR